MSEVLVAGIVAVVALGSQVLAFYFDPRRRAMRELIVHVERCHDRLMAQDFTAFAKDRNAQERVGIARSLASPELSGADREYFADA